MISKFDDRRLAIEIITAIRCAAHNMANEGYLHEGDMNSAHWKAIRGQIAGEARQVLTERFSAPHTRWIIPMLDVGKYPNFDSVVSETLDQRERRYSA